LTNQPKCTILSYESDANLIPQNETETQRKLKRGNGPIGLFDIASREIFSPGFYTASGGEPMKTN